MAGSLSLLRGGRTVAGEDREVTVRRCVASGGVQVAGIWEGWMWCQGEVELVTSGWVQLASWGCHP